MVGPCSDTVDVETDQSPLIRFEIEVNPRTMLKFKSSLDAVAFPVNHDKGCHESDYFKVLAQFIGVPDLAVLGFDSFTTSGLGIDFHETLAT
jgi:hypothetical protein